LKPKLEQYKRGGDYLLYKQTVKAHNNYLFLIALSVVISLILMSVLSFFETWEYMPLAEMIIIIINLIFIIRMLVISKVEYMYRLIGNELIIKKVKGKKEKLLADFNLDNILLICEKNNLAAEKYKNIKSIKSYVTVMNFSHRYILIYSVNNKIHKYIFQPNNEMVEFLKNSLGDRVCIKN